MIYLNNLNYTKKKEKYKHLSKEMLDKIESEYNNFIFSRKKSKKKTEFMKELSKLIGTTLSNLYNIINDGLVEVLAYDLTKRIEFSAEVAWQHRNKKSIESNSSKRESSKEFIKLIIKDLESEYNINSVDEIIHDLIQNRQDEIEGLETICTATFYNYVEAGKIDNFNKSLLPLKGKRKSKNEHKEGKRKRTNINSIENRSDEANSRLEFGHWEGDTVVGSSQIKNSGACFTLVERKTRFQIVIKMKDRKAETVLKAIKKIKKLYPELKDFKLQDIFKSITFDNGVEFSKWKDIEKFLHTTIYFAHPYSSYERGSNENGNKLLRLFLPKSCDMKQYTESYVMRANELINTKIRKILGYKSSLELFTNELTLLTQSAI